MGLPSCVKEHGCLSSRTHHRLDPGYARLGMAMLATRAIREDGRAAIPWRYGPTRRAPVTEHLALVVATFRARPLERRTCTWRKIQKVRVPRTVVSLLVTGTRGLARRGSRTPLGAVRGTVVLEPASKIVCSRNTQGNGSLVGPGRQRQITGTTLASFGHLSEDDAPVRIARVAGRGGCVSGHFETVLQGRVGISSSMRKHMIGQIGDGPQRSCELSTGARAIENHTGFGKETVNPPVGQDSIGAESRHVTVESPSLDTSMFTVAKL